MNTAKRIEILGIPVDMVSMAQAVEILGGLMKSMGCSLIVTPNSEIIVNAGKDPKLKEIITSADLVIPDGIGLVYASKILGCPLTERVTGIDFLNWILDWLEQNGKSIYLLGSKPGIDGNPGIADLAAKRMKETYPGLSVAGTHHGYFSESEEVGIVEKINQSGADFLCVALGAPKQEKFIARYQKSLNAKAAIGVGGSLDVWAGTAKRAPEFYQKHGLEWLYRFAREPSRYRRITALPLFMIKVLITRGR
ncbi:MAG: WecB/TagA/CpsF family glycosyltransferase [Eubacteriales bacterium]|nr:WecB/TagA/CpsF family glycosyltransferase [Eubacteriales bacterium]MDD4584049.1 WecB/TagA/CpsF family glycosyltransferase [Eubacteriales bacterium]